MQGVNHSMTPSFDLVPEQMDTAALPHSLLIMEAAEHHFRYLAYDRASSRVLCLRHYSIDPTADKTNTDLLQDIISNDDLLQYPIRDAAVIYNYSDSSLLPEKFFHIELNKPLTDLSYGTVKRGLVLSEKVHGWALYNVYRIPRDVHELMQNKFSAGKYWHSNSLLLAGTNKSELGGPVIHLMIYEDKFTVSFFTDHRLQLMQTFPYETPEDVSYYLLAICNQFNVAQEKMKLKLSGLVDEDSALYQEILKYFLHVTWENVPDSIAADIITAAHPRHYFSPLLRMTVCV